MAANTNPNTTSGQLDLTDTPAGRIYSWMLAHPQVAAWQPEDFRGLYRTRHVATSALLALYDAGLVTAGPGGYTPVAK